MTGRENGQLLRITKLLPDCLILADPLAAIAACQSQIGINLRFQVRRPPTSGCYTLERVWINRQNRMLTHPHLPNENCNCNQNIYQLLASPNTKSEVVIIFRLYPGYPETQELSQYSDEYLFHALLWFYFAKSRFKLFFQLFL